MMENFLRLDVFLVENKMVSSRSRAQILIKDKKVIVNNMVESKPSKLINPQDVIKIIGDDLKYVGRGGYKLEKAINDFNINLNGNICIDIGASTGGFTDAMLQNGAKKVYAIDVGHSQLDKKLLNDKRVINLEKTNIRNVDFSLIKDKINFVSTDVSFISLKHVIPVINIILKRENNIKQSAVLLIKPQFEAGKKHLNKKGIVTNKKIHQKILKDIQNTSNENDFIIKDMTFSPIKGAEGNIEYLFYLCRKNGIISYNIIDFEKIINEAFKEAV